MLFNSYSFLLLFLPLTLAVFYGLLLKRSADAAIFALGVASLAFYAWWDVANLPLLLLSIFINFLLARRVAAAEGKNRTRWFVGGVVLNLIILAVFKYAGFITTNLHALSSSIPVVQFALPLAISFFTFQQISFLRGVYSSTDYVPRFVRYATFISFFPHLIAGPILHHKEIQPQFGQLARAVPWASIMAGITLFAIGLFKKVMIADPIGTLADGYFVRVGAGESLMMLEAWSATMLYGFQLYFDFSGYSDMAIGLAALFGIRFPQNFASPYKALSISDFWRRWHITLSQFLRDFLYIPLGGNRCGVPRTLLNLTVTMALGGLWHGASWNFLIWGLLHGVLLAIHAVWQRTGFRLPRGLAWFLTFTCVMAAWVWFRAPDITSALALYNAMFSLPAATSFTLSSSLEPVAYWLSAALAICLLAPHAYGWVWEGTVPYGKKLLCYRHSFVMWLSVVLVFLVAFAHVSRLSIFLYFNF